MQLQTDVQGRKVDGSSSMKHTSKKCPGKRLKKQRQKISMVKLIMCDPCETLWNPMWLHWTNPKPFWCEIKIPILNAHVHSCQQCCHTRTKFLCCILCIWCSNVQTAQHKPCVEHCLTNTKASLMTVLNVLCSDQRAKVRLKSDDTPAAMVLAAQLFSLQWSQQATERAGQNFKLKPKFKGLKHVECVRKLLETKQQQTSIERLHELLKQSKGVESIHCRISLFLCAAPSTQHPAPCTCLEEDL